MVRRHPQAGGAGRLRPPLPGLIPGQPDGLGDELGGTPGPLHGKFGEHGAGQLVRGAAGLLALERADGLGELFQAENADRVIEQAQLGTHRT